MNYAAHYDRLIERARVRVLTGYCERHHVLPRCMGGGDEPQNIVELTAEEHYVAHQLLVRIHPNHAGLAHAAVYMAKRVTGNKAYGWLRRRIALAAGDRFRGKTLSPEHRAKIGAKSRGKTLSEQSRSKIADAHRGSKASTETRARMSAAKRGNTNGRGGKGIPKSTEHRSKIAEANRGRVYSQATLDKMSASQRGKVASPASRAKMSAARLGRKLTPEHIAKSAEARRGLLRSPEARARMSLAQRRRDPSTRYRFFTLPGGA